MTNFFDKINKLFAFLPRKYGFLETERLFDKQCFGNAVLVLSSKCLKFIFTRDRDFDSVSIALIGEEDEFDLQILKAYILADPIEGEYIKKVNLKSIAKFVNDNYEKINDEFSKIKYSRTRRELKKLQIIRYKKLMSR